MAAMRSAIKEEMAGLLGVQSRAAPLAQWCMVGAGTQKQKLASSHAVLALPHTSCRAAQQGPDHLLVCCQRPGASAATRRRGGVTGCNAKTSPPPGSGRQH